jgi:23S rRNA (adenine2503-C2)-methyltransferase
MTSHAMAVKNVEPKKERKKVMLKEIAHKKFANGVVYLLNTEDGYPIEVTDTFLPYYTKDAIGPKQNALKSGDLGSRLERWMIGVSVMSGCPVGCKFCATGNLKRCRNLTAEEILQQVQFVLDKNIGTWITEAKEFKINYTRMGEPFLNIENVKSAIKTLNEYNPKIHHYISTIGIMGANYSWIKPNMTLQFSVHSFDENYRNWLIPYKYKITLDEMGKVRTASRLKTTLNLTMARAEDFSMEKLSALFDKDKFFIKISPINENDVSKANNLGEGIIHQANIV